MRMGRIASVALIGLALAAGCNSNGPKEPTAKETARKQWNDARASVLANLAKQQLEGGNFDDCRKSLNEAIVLSPDLPKIRILSAKLYIEQGKLELAVKELEQASTQDPKDANVDYLMGVVFQRWQRPQQALEAYTRASEKAPAELAYFLARAEMLVALDQRDTALELLQDRLTYFENSPAIRDFVGQLLVQKGQYSQAVPVLRQASILGADDATIRVHLAMALFSDKQYREASTLLEKLLKDDRYSNRCDLMVALGECQLQTDRTREARDTFQTVAQLQPGNVANWINLGKVGLELADYKRAELSIRKAQSLDPQSVEAVMLSGYLRVKQNKLPEALAAFRKASAMDPKDPTSLCMTGVVLEKMGKPTQAIGYYGKALKLKPNDDFAASLLAQVQLHE